MRISSLAAVLQGLSTVIILHPGVLQAGYTYRNVADSTGGFNFSYPYTDKPAINAHGTVAFVARRGSTDRGIWISSGGPALPVVINTGGPFLAFGDGTPPSINASGTVAFPATVRDGGSGVWSISTGSGGLVTTPLIMFHNTMWAGFGKGAPSINAGGDLAFLGGTTTHYTGIFRLSPAGVLTRIAWDSGPGAAFSDLTCTRVSQNDSGMVAFTGSSIEEGVGVFAGDGNVLKTIDTAETSRVVSDCAPVINASGMVAFHGHAMSGGRTGIYIGNGSSPAVLFASSFGGPYLDFDSESLSINAAGTVVFSAVSFGCSCPEGLFTGPVPATSAVVRKGDPLFGSTLTYAGIGSHAINDRGEIVFSYALADGRKGVAVAVPDTLTLPPAPQLTIPSATVVDGGLNLLISGAPLRHHVIQAGTDPAGPFTMIDAFPADADGRIEFSEPVLSGPMRFYRALLP